MSDRTRSDKTLAQDVTGFLCCLVGGFFAVSLVLFLRGQEPKPGLVSVVTGPVVQLGAWLGVPSALALSLAVAALGATLFLQRRPLAAGRWLGVLAVTAIGLACVLGAALDRGGALGAFFPGLMGGLGGRVLGIVLGVALLWIAWSLVPLGHPDRATSASDAFQSLGLGSRREPAAGVSAAEAALLVTERPPTAPRPAPPRPAPPRRDETPKPHGPAGGPAAPKEGRGAKAKDVPVEGGNSRSRPAARPDVAASAASAGPAASTASAGNVRPLGAPRAVPPPAEPDLATASTPPAPAWELEDEAPAAPAAMEAELEEPVEPEPAPEPALARATPAEVELEPELEPELDEEELVGSPAAEEDDDGARGIDEDEEDDEDEAELALDGAGSDEDELEPEAAPPAAAWEQEELFEAEPDAAPARAARSELTPTFDFDADVAPRTVHEPEVVAESEDPFAVEPLAESSAPPRAAGAGEDLQTAEPESLLQPVPPPPRAAPKRKARRAAEVEPAPEPAPAAEPDAARAGWEQLVFDAGCAILEENRVAVSMLERRFTLDFDQACRVLDELQEAGLIGPYMGGRTRDILLTREEWLSHAPRAS